MKVYLAGGMKGGWPEHPALQTHELLDPRSWSCEDPAEYTARDLAAIREADAVLVYMDSRNPSGFGLSVELGYAYGIGKRVLFVDQIGGDWRSPYFGMHRTMAETYCSIEEAVEAL